MQLLRRLGLPAAHKQLFVRLLGFNQALELTKTAFPTIPRDLLGNISTSLLQQEWPVSPNGISGKVFRCRRRLATCERTARCVSEFWNHLG